MPSAKSTYWTERRKKFRSMGLCRCGKQPQVGYAYCRNASLKSWATWRNEAWGKVLAHYGRKCVCCGEDNPGFLTIDHKDGTGHVDRKANKNRGGWTFYYKIVKLGFPKNLQLLCFNCNCGKQRLGRCPHENAVR